MSAIDWSKIDKFLIVFVGAMVLLVGLLIFTFRNIFSAFNIAGEISQATLDAELKINEDELEEAYKWVFENNELPVKLDM